jgi:hypothetical protein
MKSSLRVEVTETSIVVLANTQFLTSIPLRRWSTIDGSTWSSQRRSPEEVQMLVSRLTEALQHRNSSSVMNRVMALLSADTPTYENAGIIPALKAA